MSSTKSPQVKKKLSLERDRRNTYGSNAKSSRKNITKSKELSRRATRRAAVVSLARAKGTDPNDEIVAVEASMRSTLTKKSRSAFVKVPDKPLGAVLKEKTKTSATSHKALGTPSPWQRAKWERLDKSKL